MRIVQLIDSLEAGGAERMAVNYANSLVTACAFSALVVTRNEGILKEHLDHRVQYKYLNKRSSLDLVALFAFRKFLKKHNVSVIHAHSSSYFFAVLVKMLLPTIRIVWHDHYGSSEFLNQRQVFPLNFFSFFFDRIITVNGLLKEWNLHYLCCKKVVCLPNFAILHHTKSVLPLEGEDGKRIVLLANLRPQKNHELLIEVACLLKQRFPDWSFHLIGKDFEDDYSKKIRAHVQQNGLHHNVYIYGSRDDVFSILSSSDIGILTSKSEGLPVALIEYGLQSLPVVSTNVGDIDTIALQGDNLILIDGFDASLFCDALESLIVSEAKRKQLGNKLHRHVLREFSETGVLKKYISFLND